MFSPNISRGLQDTTLTNGTPAVMVAGKQRTLSSTITSGLCLAIISLSLGSE